METNYKIISNEERIRIEAQLLEHGRAWFAKDPTSELFFAECARENRDDVAAYAHLLNANRLGAKDIPQQTVEQYKHAAQVTPKEVLKSEDGYEGCLALGKQLFARSNPEDEARGIYYMTFAANSAQDNYGVAARILADHLSANPANYELYMHYEALAAQKGNPDVLPVLCGRKAAAHREVAV